MGQLDGRRVDNVNVFVINNLHKFLKLEDRKIACLCRVSKMGAINPNVLGMDREELAALMEEAGEPAYRAKQIVEAVYRQRVESLERDFHSARGISRKLAGKRRFR